MLLSQHLITFSNKLGVLFIFHFQVDTNVNSGQTVPVNYITNAESGSSTGSMYGVLGNLILLLLLSKTVFLLQTIGTSISDTLNDPTMGAWNMLSCRITSLLTLGLTEQNANGVVLGVDLYAYADPSASQTIFAFRDTANLDMELSLEVWTNGLIYGWTCCYGTGSMQRFVTSATVNWSKLTVYRIILSHSLFYLIYLDAWNRIVFEIVQAQPTEFAVGYSAVRVWINGVVMTKTYFGNYAPGSYPEGDYLFNNLNDVEIQFCARRNSDSMSLVLPANFDLLNIVWFRGAEGLFAPTTAQGKL